MEDIEKLFTKYGQSLQKNSSKYKDDIWEAVNNRVVNTLQPQSKSNLLLTWFMRFGILSLLIIFGASITVLTNLDKANYGLSEDTSNSIGNVSKKSSDAILSESIEDSNTAKSTYEDSSEVYNMSDSEYVSEKDRAKEKNAEITLEVEDMQLTVNDIYTLLEQYNAYTEVTDISTIWSTLEIKVSADNFDKLCSKIRNLGKVTYERIVSQDLQNNINQISAEIEQLQSEIESLQAELQNTSDEQKKEELQIEIAQKQKLLDEKTDSKEQLINTSSWQTIYLKIVSNVAEFNEFEYEISELKENLENVVLLWLKIVSWLVVGIVFVAPFWGVVKVGRALISRK